MSKSVKLPQALRNAVWNEYVGAAQGTATCFCCGLEPILRSNYECGHVRSRARGGSDKLDNLRPVCGACNQSMGTKDMIEFAASCGFTCKVAPATKGTAAAPLEENKEGAAAEGAEAAEGTSLLPVDPTEPANVAVCAETKCALCGKAYAASTLAKNGGKVCGRCAGKVKADSAPRTCQVLSHQHPLALVEKGKKKRKCATCTRQDTVVYTCVKCSYDLCLVCREIAAAAEGSTAGAGTGAGAGATSVPTVVTSAGDDSSPGMDIEMQMALAKAVRNKLVGMRDAAIDDLFELASTHLPRAAKIAALAAAAPELKLSAARLSAVDDKALKEDLVRLCKARDIDTKDLRKNELVALLEVHILSHSL